MKLEVANGHEKEIQPGVKLEALKLVTQRGVSVPKATKDLDVHENVLSKWVRELREAPQEAPPGQGKQKVQDNTEIARLRKEAADINREP